MPVATETQSETLSHAPTRRLEGWDAPIQGCVYICSVAPVHRYAYRPHNRVVTVKNKNGEPENRIGLGVEYFIDAAPRDSYRVLAVYDAFVILRDLREFKEELVQSFEAKPIPSFVVASDLMSQWSGSLLGGKYNFSPGVGLISKAEPTPEELSRLKSLNTAWCEWCVNDANEMQAKGYFNDIHVIHRRAAEWLYDTGAHQFPWYKERKQVDLKDCPACLNKIPLRAFSHPNCCPDLVEFHIKWGTDPDAFLKPYYDKRIEQMTQPGV